MSDSFIESLVSSLAQAVDAVTLDFDGIVMNPLDYARASHLAYQEMALAGGNEVLFLGMNPGPDGMMQTGVPFGARSMVRDYLHLDVEVDRPAMEHPRRPVTGLEGRREEPSGHAFWSMVRSCHSDVGDFFSYASVQNFCPLCLLSGERGTNVTPDKLPRACREELERPCQEALEALVSHYGVRTAVGIGNYAYDKLCRIKGLRVLKIPHPSPINPGSRSWWQDDGKAVVDFLKGEGVLR